MSAPSFVSVHAMRERCKTQGGKVGGAFSTPTAGPSGLAPVKLSTSSLADVV